MCVCVFHCLLCLQACGWPPLDSLGTTEEGDFEGGRDAGLARRRRAAVGGGHVCEGVLTAIVYARDLVIPWGVLTVGIRSLAVPDTHSADPRPKMRRPWEVIGRGGGGGGFARAIQGTAKPLMCFGVAGAFIEGTQLVVLAVGRGRPREGPMLWNQSKQMGFDGPSLLVLLAERRQGCSTAPYPSSPR